MLTIVNCIATQHDPLLLALAASLCGFGVWVTAGLYFRTVRGHLSNGLWLFLAGVVGAATVFGTHFSAMLAWDPDTGLSFDPLLTATSLLVAAGGITLAFQVASRVSSLLGGALFGAAVAGMHYTGMAALVIEGITIWDRGYVAGSVVAAIVFGALAMWIGHRLSGQVARLAMACVMLLSIVSLHFTGMSAMQVFPFASVEGMSAAAQTTLALSIIGVALIIILSALAMNIIENRSSAAAMMHARRMALHDPLTELPNRTQFMQKLETVIQERGDVSIAVLGVDLDHFKEINDNRGHAAGDAALQAVAIRMSAVLTRGEFLARLGGDEFAAFKIDCTPEQASEFATRLRAQLQQMIQLPDGSEAVIDASFGVAMYPVDTKSPATLLNNADLAMYRAKKAPDTNVAFYQAEMDETVRARRQIVSDLRVALASGQFEVHYQIQADVDAGHTTGYEALLRWRHPERGQISPADFIPIAEETGLIVTIGEWVLRTACRDAATWANGERVAVNISAVQLAQHDLPALVSAVLAETGLPASRLELELTETSLMVDPARNMEVLRRVRDLGVAVAMDDFGTGYSSLSTLRAFPFDKIKLDRSFMSDDSPEAKAIIRAVLALGRSLNVPILAEGVETVEQLSFLKAEGCNEAQGFLLGRPAPYSAARTTPAAMQQAIAERLAA